MAAHYFTPRELEQLVAVLLSHKDPFDVCSWRSYHQRSIQANRSIATVRLRQIRRTREIQDRSLRSGLLHSSAQEIEGFHRRRR